MGGGSRRRKGKAPSPPEGGLRSPSPTPSVSGSVAGELAAGMSYDVPVKLPRTEVAESVADVAGVTRGMAEVTVAGAPLGTRLLQILGAVAIPEPFKRTMVAEVRSMMSKIEILEFKSKNVGVMAESVLELDAKLKLTREELSEKDEMMARVEASRASACKELLGARSEVARMEKWVANCKRDYERGEEYTKSVLSERTRYRDEVRRLEARLAGKIKEGVDKGTRVDRDMLEQGEEGT